jgi:hypothetical protein
VLLELRHETERARTTLLMSLCMNVALKSPDGRCTSRHNVRYPVCARYPRYLTVPTVPHGTHGTLQYPTVPYGTNGTNVTNGTLRYLTVPHSTFRYPQYLTAPTVPYGTLRYLSVPHGTLRYPTVRVDQLRCVGSSCSTAAVALVPL